MLTDNRLMMLLITILITILAAFGDYFLQLLYLKYKRCQEAMHPVHYQQKQAKFKKSIVSSIVFGIVSGILYWFFS